MWCPHPLLYSQRLSSTTTRIKTTPSAAVLATASVVRDYLPLQQGLRPKRPCESLFLLCGVRDYLPLQQGLRPARTWLKNSPLLVRDYLPLQQGLRRFPSPSAGLIDFLVRDYLPLQQGLRLSAMSSNVKSEQSETIFHYNKD